MESFITFLSHYINPGTELKAKIQHILSVRELEKEQVLLKMGNACETVYFLKKGTVRCYFLNEEGKDVTTWIYPENSLFTSWNSFLNQQPSPENIETCESSEVIAISFDQLNSLYLDFPEMERFGRLVAEDQVSMMDEYSRGYLFLSAKEKMDRLHAFFPDVTQRVNLGHIASFLGISQETLSRVRR